MPLPRQPLLFFPSLLIGFHFLQLYLNRILQYFFGLSFITHDDFGIHPCFFMLNSYIYLYCWVAFHCMDIPPFYTFINNFQVLAITKKAAMNSHMQVCVWKFTFFSFKEIPRIWMTAPHGVCLSTFKEITKLFSKVIVPVYIPTICVWVVAPSYSHQHLIWLVYYSFPHDK